MNTEPATLADVARAVAGAVLDGLRGDGDGVTLTQGETIALAFSGVPAIVTERDGFAVLDGRPENARARAIIDNMRGVQQ